jgi:hypothetical protein
VATDSIRLNQPAWDNDLAFQQDFFLYSPKNFFKHFFLDAFESLSFSHDKILDKISDPVIKRKVGGGSPWGDPRPEENCPKGLPLAWGFCFHSLHTVDSSNQQIQEYIRVKTYYIQPTSEIKHPEKKNQLYIPREKVNIRVLHFTSPHQTWSEDWIS